MKQQNEELSLATKVKIVGAMALVSALIVVSTGIGVALQKENKVQAAELAKTQLANVEAMKTSFPRFRDTEEFKERAKMAMTKISVDDLPATITAGLDETVSSNPQCDINEPSGVWQINKEGGGIVASFGNENGWVVAAGGNISIPVSATYGKYKLVYWSDDECVDQNDDPGILKYHYVFKITPPCPTGVTLTVTATPQ